MDLFKNSTQELYVNKYTVYETYYYATAANKSYIEVY